MLEFGQGGDFVPQQVLAEDLGIEGERSPNVIVPAVYYLYSELYHNQGRTPLGGQMRLEAMIMGLLVPTVRDRTGEPGAP